MAKTKKSEKSLLEELPRLRRRLAELEKTIAKHNRTEEVLKESEARYRLIFEKSGEGIIVADVETMKFKYVNQTICKMLGYSEKELTRMRVRDVHPKESLKRVISEFQAQASGRKILAKDIPCLRSDGKIIYADIIATRIFIEGRKCNVGFFTDITARKQAEREFLFKSALLEAQSETTIDGILVVDEEGKSILFNKRFGRMWKIPQHLLDSRDDDKMLQCVTRQLKDPEGFLKRVKYLYARRKEKSWDELEFKDGRVFDRYSSPLSGPGGKYYGRIWYFSDITDCKKAVAKLRESEQKYRSLADNLNALVYRAEPRTLQVTYVNRTVKRFYGYSVKEWLSEPVLWENSIYPEDKKRTLRELREAKRDLKSTIVEYRILTRNKKVRWVQDYISWDKDKNGKAVSMNGVMYDITASKVAEEKLENARDLLDSRVRERTTELEKTNEELRKEITERRQIEEMLRNEKEFSECLIRSSFDGILAFDHNYRYTVWNAGMQRISGVNESEVIGKCIFDVFPSFKKTGEDKFFSETLKGKVVVARDRPYTIPKTGRHGFFEGYYSPLKDKAGKIVGGIAIIHDITERKRAEEQLMAYQKQLRSLASELSLAEERLRRRMAVGLHDLVGQNIAVSKIKLASLRQPVSSEEFDKTLSEIECLLTETLQSTISLTFELSPPVLYELGFKAAMEWLVRQTEARHGVPAEFRDDGCDKPLEMNVSVLLFQAVRELLVNAVKHARAKNLTVLSRKTDNRIRIIVEDDGVGFELSEDNLQNYLTGGFGLFSIRERLNHIGGCLDIQSEPGAGTRVVLEAPLLQKDKKSKGNNK